MGGVPTSKVAAKVKVEKNEAEKIFHMTEAADTLKLKHERLFPLNPPQRQSRLKAMFAAPRGVDQKKRTPGFYAHYIQDIGGIDVKSSKVFGPSQSLIKMFMKKSCSPQMMNLHCQYAMENLMFIKAKNTHVLIFEPHPFLRDSLDRRPVSRLVKCLSSSRRRWLAANLIRFPTSPQVVAAQIVRNFARVYSEENNVATPEEFQTEIKRLIKYCTGIERALMPEGHMEMINHFDLSWHRIRKRVLERMLEEANKQTPATQNNFLAGMPFNITSITELVSQINLMMRECVVLWEKEIEGEVVLSDGPMMGVGEDVESMEVAMGQEMQYEGGMGGRTANQSMQQMQPVQSVTWAPPANELPAASSRMNQIYQYQQQQRKTQMAGGPTLASALDQVLRSGDAAAAAGSSSMPWNGAAARGGPAPQMIPQMTPSRGGERAEGQGLRVRIRRDEHNQHFVNGTPSASPSTSTTHIRETTEQQTLAEAPSSSAAATATTPRQQQQQMQPPPPLQRTPRPLPQSGTPFGVPQEGGVAGTAPHLVQSPFHSSLHLFAVGPNGMMQSVPSVVYVQQTAQGLVEVTPPTPQPQFVMTIPSMGSTGTSRSESGSVRRRVSRGQQILKRRRSAYGDSGDGSSEDSAEDERRKQRVKERRKEEEKRKKEEEERIENEERESKEKEEKEEEDMRKKEEEEAEERKKKENERMELEKVRKEQELKAAAMERTRLAEEERKTKEKQEEEARDKGVRVLAADSSEGSGEEEEGVASEDEVVPESVVAQSDHEEEREEEIATSAATTTDTVGNRREAMVEASAAKMTPVTGVAAPPPLPRAPREDADSDIEIVFTGPGEKRQMSAGYCEVVKELIEVKKELDEKADNEVIYLKQTKSAEGSRTSRVSRRNRESLAGWIKEKKGEVKEEEEGLDQQKEVDSMGMPPLVVPPRNGMEERSETTVKTEEEEEEEEKSEGSTLTQRAGETNSADTGMPDCEVKSEVKEEEMEEEEEDVATMNERRDGENEEVMEDTMNRSADGEEEGMKGMRSVLEAMPQDSSSQVTVAAALSDATAAATAATEAPPSESLPMETTPLSAVTVAPAPTVVNGPMEVPQTTPPRESSLPLPLPVSTPAPRPVPLRVSSHGEKGPILSPRRPPLKTRLSAEMIKTIEKADSFTLPYQGRIAELEGRAEKEKETSEQREKEKEDVQVIKEVPVTESDPHTLRFHVMRGEAATLSEDRRRATRDESLDSHSKSVVFTHRPLYKGERITLRVIEISPEWKGKLRLGLTTKNPLEYSSRDAIPKQLKTMDAERDVHHLTYLYDSGSTSTVKMGTVMEVELTEKGDVMKYSMDGVEKGTLGSGLQVARPMWMIVDIYGFVKGVEIVQSVFPPQDPLGMEAAAGDQKNTRRFKMEVDESLMRVKDEVKSEESSQPPPAADAADAALGEELSDKERREIPPPPTENLPSVAVESSTVEKPAEEGTEDENGVEGEGDGVASEEGEEAIESVEDKEVEEEDGEISISRVEKRSIEKEVGEFEEGGEGGEGGEPPMKKMRVHLEHLTEVIVEKERLEEEEDVEEEGKEEENGIEESQVDVVIGEEEEAEEVQRDRVEVAEDGLTVMGDEKEEGGKEGEVVDGMEEDELMEDTVEKSEKEAESDGSGVIVEGEEKEDAASEHATEKEGGEKEESNETMNCPGEKIGLNDQTEYMGTEEEKETTIAVDSIVDECMEVEEMPPPPAPPRRRSLFGPGCLSFDQTLDGKDKNGEENEQKMEVDEEETIEMVETVPTRRLSLFGPGSASFSSILNRMHDKQF